MVKLYVKRLGGHLCGQLVKDGVNSLHTRVVLQQAVRRLKMSDTPINTDRNILINGINSVIDK